MNSKNKLKDFNHLEKYDFTKNVSINGKTYSRGVTERKGNSLCTLECQGKWGRLFKNAQSHGNHEFFPFVRKKDNNANISE